MKTVYHNSELAVTSHQVLRWLVFLLVIVLIVGFAGWLGFRTLAFYYQAQAGELLTETQKVESNDPSGDWNLPPIPLSSPQARTQLAQAISALQKSMWYNSGDSQSYLLLGRAYMLMAQPDQAVQAYRTYVQMRPQNPLGHLELGFAYEMQCGNKRLIPLSDCPGVIAQWRTGGLDPSQFAALGDDAFKQRHWTEALTWYQLEEWRTTVAGMSSQLPFDLLFKDAVAAALAQSTDSAALLAHLRERDPVFRVYPVQRSITIDGTELRWMTRIGDGKQVNYGTPLSNGGSGIAGFLWWNGQAMALLSVTQDGDFLLRANLRDSDPPPVEMAIGIDGRQLQHVTLSRGDNSWETITLPVSLTKGFHSIDLWYFNDGVVNGKDRNAAVEWVTIDH